MQRSLRHLQEMVIFAKVGEMGSISGAGRALGLPKSTVSRAVARLEDAFAARLIERTTRKVTLTEVGQAFHTHCLRLVDEVEDAEAEVAAHQGHPSGRLRVASPYVVGHVFLRPYVADFLARYPEIDLQLQLTDRPLNPVSDGFDVVIHVGWLEDSSMIARKIANVNAILVASSSYVEANGLPDTPEDLERHAVIGLPLNEARTMSLVKGQQRIKVPIWPRFACNDPLMNVEFVERGLAVAPISTFIAGEQVRNGAWHRVLPDFELADQPGVYALFAGRTALSPKIGVFLDYLTELATRFRNDPALIQL